MCRPLVHVTPPLSMVKAEDGDRMSSGSLLAVPYARFAAARRAGVGGVRWRRLSVQGPQLEEARAAAEAATVAPLAGDVAGQPQRQTSSAGGMRASSSSSGLDNANPRHNGAG